jgi:hypothetical protein
MAFNLRLSNIPPITKATLVASFLLSLLSSAFRYRLYIAQTVSSSQEIDTQLLTVPFLTIIPGESYLFPWTLLTATFVQQNVFTVYEPQTQG